MAGKSERRCDLIFVFAHFTCMPQNLTDETPALSWIRPILAEVSCHGCNVSISVTRSSVRQSIDTMILDVPRYYG